MVKLFIALLAGTLILLGFSYSQNDKKEHIPSQIKPSLLSSQEVYLLESLVNAEGKSEPHIGKVAIAAVVLNRLKNNNFPKSVEAIIFQPGQFLSVNNGEIWSIQSEDSARKAVIDAINGHDPTEGSVYYYNPEVFTMPSTYSPVKQIGKYIFCKLSTNN
ncbi:spore germination cell wall hydrolase CwlJ-like protein [Paenibacillus sp. V4I9]|uniref:cell wall hydrolase n=1 Tax=Paenibacillus sp. V4I9 TaxID=3042308 RepID=UPI002789E250|nr:cell wall hydrolase [Paenibacillus sp. V4I9]MDQ0888797.1 spore germination cell wall hydrolase CwlJ-like protein [Paenibacillus sp. V4I9]